ncbi:hypothetical protein Anae109_0301 [Anaeromyxobacter sp. Fw109-5]|nr:hypothetical protein Anae109_0301 [Anaeromyxobacter sp. Fw109-5]
MPRCCKRQSRPRVSVVRSCFGEVGLLLEAPRPRGPDQFLDALVARAINASLGRWEAFWAPNSYSAVA